MGIDMSQVGLPDLSSGYMVTGRFSDYSCTCFNDGF